MWMWGGQQGPDCCMSPVAAAPFPGGTGSPAGTGWEHGAPGERGCPLTYHFPQLPRLLLVGRRGAVRGLRVGGHGLRQHLQVGQPDCHSRHQPPGPERPHAPAAPGGRLPEALRGLRVSIGLWPARPHSLGASSWAFQVQGRSPSEAKARLKKVSVLQCLAPSFRREVPPQAASLELWAEARRE